ncbi:serine hydrolase domain-containing protein [Streptosporangium sp. NPDC000396]|uniref:serine hydrolase domain-containing protein n=1 Tax=Streptosporangium sp. NPDC000396 TaxID=3366185 RepID=UPI00367AE575
MNARIFVVGAALIAPLAVGPAASGASLTTANVDRYVKEYMERTGLPGAIVTVTKGDQVVHAAGYGRDAYGKAITRDTPMPLASLSKSFTALGVMRLVDAGKVNLDAPVRQYLPEFTMADPRAEKITVRQLLNQTSGMADSTFPELTLPAPDTLKDSVAMLRGARLAARPGTKMTYHNPNYTVAARLVEVVAGKPFADYMAAEVFRPFGMRSTTTVDTTAQLPGEARGYIRAYRQVIPRSHPRWFVNGGFGVVSTAGDMAHWLIKQNGGDRAVQATHTPSAVAGSDYGMGWWARKTAGGTPMLQHTGWLLTHNSAQTLLPGTGYGIAVVTNTGMMSGDDSLIISEGLIELAEGRTPPVAEPFTMTADLVLAALTLVAVALVLAGVFRARAWAGRVGGRPLWRIAIRLAPYALPVVAFATLADLLGLLMNRSGTLDQITYAWLALYVFFAAMALAGAGVIAARTVHLIRSRLHHRPPR